MKDAWTRILAIFGAASDAGGCERLELLEKRVSSLVEHRMPQLGAEQLGGYVWARARAAGLVDDGAADRRLLDELVARIQSRQSQVQAYGQAA